MKGIRNFRYIYIYMYMYNIRVKSGGGGWTFKTWSNYIYAQLAFANSSCYSKLLGLAIFFNRSCTGRAAPIPRHPPTLHIIYVMALAITRPLPSRSALFLVGNVRAYFLRQTPHTVGTAIAFTTKKYSDNSAGHISNKWAGYQVIREKYYSSDLGYPLNRN